mmetsp:Transcript_18261/g.52090  ORF Transcript_18261/g.52090 Transcript_18261/m.52090 type:complete len:692 (+) Transcript_18261:1114-3189(+)
MRGSHDERARRHNTMDALNISRFMIVLCSRSFFCFLSSFLLPTTNGSLLCQSQQDDGDNKSTRFAEGTKTEAQQAEQVKRPMLARDHSLGREFLPEGDNMAIDNFSWQDPFQSSRSISFSSMGSLPGIAAAIANANGQPGGPAAPSHPNAPPPPPPHAVYGPPAGRTSSHGSMGMHPPYHTSVGGPPPHHQTHPPPPPDYYGRVASGANEDRRRNFSGGRYESWGSIGSLSSLPPYPGGAAGPPAQGPAPPPGTAYGGPPGGPGGPPPPPPPGAFAHQRSGSWTQGPPFPPPSRGATHQRSGSWSHGREHSLMMNPLTGASTTHPATPFDGNGHMGGGRSASGYWGRNPPPPGAYAHSPSASRHHPAGPYRESSNTMSPYGARSPGSNNTSPKAPNIIPPARNGAHTGPPPAGSTTPTPNYNVDMNIAKTWSGGGEIRKTWSNEEASGTGGDGNRASPSRASWGRDQYQKPLSDEVVVGGRSTDVSPLRDSGAAIMPKPNMVKRDTSHQNESYETKPSIKRAALNRDQSATSNRLKQQYVPELFNGNKSKSIAKFDREMRMLSNDLEYTNIKEPSRIDNNGAPKPKRLGETDRLSTLDTVDKITLELMDKPPPLLADNRTSTIDALDLDLDESFPPARPPALKDENRLSTMDFLDMVNTPLQEEIEGDGNNDNAPLTLADESVANEWLGKV